MPSWDNILNTVNRWTDKANAVADDLADRTALHIKLTTRRSDLEKEYAALGKLAYRKLSPDAPDASDLTEQINRSMSRIAAIASEIADIEAKMK